MRRAQRPRGVVEIIIANQGWTVNKQNMNETTIKQYLEAML